MRRTLLTLALLLNGCAFDIRPTVLIRLQKSSAARNARNPALSQMRYAISFSGNGASDTYAGPVLRGRSPICLGLSGTVSKLYTYDEILAGVSLPVSSGTYTASLVGILSSASTATTVPEAMAGSTLEMYPIANRTVDVAQGESASLADRYTGQTVPELISVTCPDLNGGVELTLGQVFSGDAGSDNGPLLFEASEGALPPINFSGGLMSVLSGPQWYSTQLFRATSPLQEYFQRLDLHFGTNPVQLNQYTSFLAEIAADSYLAPVAGLTCGAPIPQAAGNFRAQVYAGSAALPNWIGSLSAPDSTRRVTAAPTPLSSLFTGQRGGRFSGGLLLSVRSTDVSQSAVWCSGLRLSQVRVYLLP